MIDLSSRVGIFVVITLLVSVVVFAIFDNNSSSGRIGNELTITIEIMVGIFIAFIIYDISTKERKQREKTTSDDEIKKIQIGKEEIYESIRTIESIRTARERIRTRQNNVPMTEELRLSEVRFLNTQVAHFIDDLSLVLLLHNQYFSPEFRKRVKDAIQGYNFIKARLVNLPLEADNAGNLPIDTNDGFIKELKKLDVN